MKVSEDPLYVKYDRRKSHHTLIVGTEVSMLERITRGLCFSILQQPNTKVYCIDGVVLAGEEEVMPFYKCFATRSDQFSLAEVYKDVVQMINETYDALCFKKKTKDSSAIFLFFSNLQYLDLVKRMLRGETIDESEYIDMEQEESETAIAESVVEEEKDFFDFGLELGGFAKKLDSPFVEKTDRTQSLNVSEKLLKLVTEGSSVGIHLIISCLEFQTIKETLCEVNRNVNKLIQKFPERFLFAMNDLDAAMLMDPSVAVSGLPEHTVYYTDSINQTCMVKPFCFPELEQLQEFVASEV